MAKINTDALKELKEITAMLCSAELRRLTDVAYGMSLSDESRKAQEVKSEK